YKERVHVPKGLAKLTLRSDESDASKVVLTYDLNANIILPGTTQPVGTSGTASTLIEGDDFTAENITFENTAGDKGQALAAKVMADRTVFRNCRFLRWQDTLCADEGRQYYRNC